MGMSYEPATIGDASASPRRGDSRQPLQSPEIVSVLEVAEHILALAAVGERDLERLKASAFQN